MIDVNELRQALQDRAGLDEEQATKAAQVALEFIAERVPQAADLLQKAGGAEDVARRIGDLFGRR